MFDLNKDDMWIFGKYITLRSMKFKFKLIKNILLFGIIMLLYGIFSKFNLATLIISELVLLFGYVYMQYAIIKLKVQKAYSKKGEYIGSHTLEIDENGIREQLPVGEDFHEWSRYTEIIQNKKYIYTFWEVNVGNVIPKRAFASQSELDSFCNIVENKIKQNKSGKIEQKQ
jgi:hypothetical protein